MYPLLILINDWIGYVENWFNHSSMVFADDEFDRMEKRIINIITPTAGTTRTTTQEIQLLLL
jgi:hypothetical protein